MKRILHRVMTALLFFSVTFLLVQDGVYAADSTENGSVTTGVYVGCEDLGDGFVAYKYVQPLDALSPIQPLNADQTTRTLCTDIYYLGSYVFTLGQTATFVYGAPNGVVTISARRGFIVAYDSNSPYRCGTISSTSTNGSPGIVTSTFGLFYASDWSRATTMSVDMHCSNSGYVY